MSADPGEIIYSVLAADGNIAAAVGTRIYPDAAPQSAPMPYIVYESPDEQFVESHDGASGLTNPKWTIEVFAATRRESWDVSEYVRLATEGIKGDYGGYAYAILLESRSRFVDAPTDGKEKPVYVTALNMSMWLNNDRPAFHPANSGG